jgi:hypothetical protein
VATIVATHTSALYGTRDIRAYSYPPLPWVPLYAVYEYSESKAEATSAVDVSNLAQVEQTTKCSQYFDRFSAIVLRVASGRYNRAIRPRVCCMEVWLHDRTVSLRQPTVTNRVASGKLVQPSITARPNPCQKCQPHVAHRQKIRRSASLVQTHPAKIVLE